MEELRFRVQGHVQGVGFRWWTRSQALRLGLSGTVRNRLDGDVEIHARGSRKALERFAAMLRQGPPHARVQRVDSEPTDGIHTPGFEIIY